MDLGSTKEVLVKRHIKHFPNALKTVIGQERDAAEKAAQEGIETLPYIDADIEADLRDTQNCYVDALESYHDNFESWNTVLTLGVVKTQANRELYALLDKRFEVESPEEREAYGDALLAVYNEQEDRLGNALARAFNQAYDRGQRDVSKGRAA